MQRWAVLALTLGLALPASLSAQKKAREVWTDPADESLPADFKFQGEYASEKMGAQVIALGEGHFQAVLLSGGLPGAGWDGKNKVLLQGKLDGDKVVFKPITAKEKRSYLAGDPLKFSATSKFPPPGHHQLSGTISGDTLAIAGVAEGDKAYPPLKKTTRTSATTGAKPPEG